MRELRPFWTITFPDLLLGLSTIALGLFTALLWWDTHQLARDAQRNTEILLSAQRAWLAPLGLVPPNKFEAPPNESLEISLRYGNVGKEPAQKSSFYAYAGFVRKDLYRDALQMETVIRDLTGGRSCWSLGPDPGGATIYPSEKADYGYVVGFNKEQRDRIAQGDVFPLVVACFAYKTNQEIHHSEFCSILEPLSNGEWRADSCFIHNSAD